MPHPTHQRYLLLNWILSPEYSSYASTITISKYQLSNWFLSKTPISSDSLIFPMFLQFVFPRLSRLRLSVFLTGIFFIFWKLPLSTPFITAYNSIAIIPITRVVDYSDLMALSVLPLAYYFIQRIDRYRIGNLPPAVLTWLVAIPASVVFMATEPPIKYYMRPGGDIHIGKSYGLNISREEALAKLKAEGWSIQPDTSQPQMSRATHYIMKNVVLDGGKDTLESIQFGFLGNGEKTTLLINNVTLKNKKTASPL